ncbi:MAG TPA: TonB-dependent receptor [Chitinophagaceae bacterium]|nr:TonB-dependent receptor [Chitinophagaceae bacterium]
MKHIFCLFIFVLIFHSDIWASTTNSNILTGRITDSTKNGLPGATVSIPDLQSGAITDNQGNYTLKNLPAGIYLVEVRYIGYKTLTSEVTIRNTTVKNFIMTPSVLEQGTVVVTGLSMATEASKNPTPITVINRRYLEQNVSTNIIDAIAKQPGVDEVTTGPAISKPVIRGLSYNRVVVVNDGIRQEGQQWGDEHGVEIDDYNVDRIEILKGPASLLYGSDGLAGVVNIISNEPLPAGTIQGNINANYLTNNGMVAYNGNIAGNLNGIYWNVYGTGKQAHDYRDNYDGYVFNSKFQNADYGGYLGVNRSWGHSRLEFASFDEHLGIPAGSRDNTGAFTKDMNINGIDSLVPATTGDFLSYQPYISRQNVQHKKLILDNEFYLANTGRIAFTLGYQVSQRREYANILAPNTPGLDLKLKTVDYDLKYYLPVVQGWESVFGINGMQQNNFNQGTEFLIPQYNLFDFGIFGMTKKTWGSLTLSGGLRFDNRYMQAKQLYLDSTGTPTSKSNPGAVMKFNGFTRNFASFSGSVGMSYALSDRFTAKANLARGFRAPNASELAANGVHDGTIRYEYGNNQLKAETSTEGDAGIIYTALHLTFSADLFYNHISHYIFARKLLSASGQDSIPVLDNAQGYIAYQDVQTNANLYGGELMIDLHPHPLDWLHFKNTFSLVRGTASDATDSTRYLPFMPPPRWMSDLRGEFLKKGRTIRNMYLEAELDINWAQHDAFTAYGTETPTAGYTLLNLELGADIMGKTNRLFSLYLGVDNLTNLAYQNHLSRFKYLPVNPATGRMGIFNMGRDFSIKLNIPLDIKG